MRKLSLVVTAVTLLLAPPVALGARWTDQQVQTAIRVADDHWTASPCLGHHNLTWVRGTELDALFPADDRSLAMGQVGGCSVWIAWDRIDPVGVYRPGVFLCTILEHEFGHNAGLEHSIDPHDVMYPDVQYNAPDCIKAFSLRRWRWHYWRRW